MDQWSERTLRAWFYVAVVVVALAGVWFNIEPSACPVPTALLSGEKPLQPVCFEFWFNRYQSLIGAIAAVGAAWYAGYWVRRQIERTDAQLQIAQAQFASDRLPIMAARIGAVSDIVSQMFEIEDALVYIGGTGDLIVENIAAIDVNREEFLKAVSVPILDEVYSSDKALFVEQTRMLCQSRTDKIDLACKITTEIPDRYKNINIRQVITVQVDDYKAICDRLIQAHREADKYIYRYISAMHNNFAVPPSIRDLKNFCDFTKSTEFERRGAAFEKVRTELDRLIALRDKMAVEADRLSDD